MTIAQDRNFLRQLEARDLILLAKQGDNELAFVLAEHLEDALAELAERKEPDRYGDEHGDCCVCFD